MNIAQIIGILFLLALAVICFPAILATVYAVLVFILNVIVACILVNMVICAIVFIVDSIFGTKLSTLMKTAEEENAYKFA